jgi:DNA-binding CsgD family transcriptional regulator
MGLALGYAVRPWRLARLVSPRLEGHVTARPRAASHSSGHAAQLQGRGGEVSVLTDLVAAVRSGESRVLVLRGEPGVGKTALLDYLADQARGCRVVRIAGVQSEMDFAHAGLHQLLAPMLDRVERLPAPQREALRTVFGISAGPPPDRFLVALAVLSLLAETAGEEPLVCVIDDQQWLDQASAQALAFAARRMAADPVGLVFAARVPGEELGGLPELTVAGLADRDARALLDSALVGPLDARVRDQIIAEAEGNPLALLELPRGVTSTELAGGFGLPGAQPSVGSVTGRIEDSFLRRLDALPEQSRRLLLLAAADPSGDPSLMWRAAGRLGLPAAASVPAVEAGLAEFGTRVRFRHPLVRSAVYRSAPFTERQGVHRALAEEIDPAVDPDRRAWHRAQAAAGPDDEVADELERSAGRSQARGGLAAAAAFLERSALLTVDPARRAERTMAAAQANLLAGAFDKALGLLVMAESGPPDELRDARVELLRAQIAFSSGQGSDAPPLLLSAARRLEPLDLDLAREAYMSAWGAALFAGYMAKAVGLREVSMAARAVPPPAHPPRWIDLLLDGAALAGTDGHAAAAPVLQRASLAFVSADTPVEERLPWSWVAMTSAIHLWDEDGWLAINAALIQLARDCGALEQVPIALEAHATAVMWCGDFPAAAAEIAEARLVAEATGTQVAPFAAMSLAALRGREGEATALIEATIAAATAGGQGAAVTWARWVSAILGNGFGRYADAAAAAGQASKDTPGFFPGSWALPELIEAAARTGDTRLAETAVGQLAETTQPGGTNFGLGVEARCRALVSQGQAAEGWYREAIDRLGRSRVRTELARAHLVYGEWLRRENRRTDARAQLRTAYDLLSDIGMEAFAERARRELLATGETARKRTAPASTAATQELTPQEAQVARLASEGLSNPEIGARLFISAHTAQYHLSKVFAKLGITSRNQLHRVLPDAQATPGS